MKKILEILTVFVVVFALFSFGNKDKKAKEVRSYSVVMADIEKAIPQGTIVPSSLYIQNLFNELTSIKGGPNPNKLFKWSKHCCYQKYYVGCGFEVECACTFFPSGYCTSAGEQCPMCHVGTLELFVGICEN